MSCHLTGCMSQGSCGAGSIREVVDGDNIAPWVRVWFQTDKSDQITVGNQSDPQANNSAVIKSFQYGASDNMGCQIVIMDQLGSDFTRFMDRLNKCIGRAAQDSVMKVQFGWVNRDCLASDGEIPSGGKGQNQTMQSEVFWLTPVSVDGTFSEGRMKYTVVGTSLLEIAMEARQAQTFGTDTNKLDLKEAIRQLFANGKPEIKDVQFVRYSPSGQLVNWEFKDTPKASWKADNQNKLSVAMDWIQPFITDKDKGCIPIFNDKVPGGQLIFLESPDPKCFEVPPTCAPNSLGTFIVGAGSCSNVISFTTTGKWTYTGVDKAGGDASKVSGVTQRDQGRPECDLGEDGVGIQVAMPVVVAAVENFGFKSSLKKQFENQATQAYANRFVHSIEGELKIQGDPTLAGVLGMSGRTCSIVVINPFYIAGNANGGCGDWLSTSLCNQVLTNKNWFVDGFDHSISEGSYTTTLKVRLPVPGSDLNVEQTFGGDPGGWKPKEPCSD